MLIRVKLTHESPLPAYKATFKTVVNTLVLHTKAKQIASDVSSNGSSVGVEKLQADFDDPNLGLTFNQRKVLDSSYDYYRLIGFRMAKMVLRLFWNEYFAGYQ